MTRLKKADMSAKDLGVALHYITDRYTECRYNDILVGHKRPWDCVDEYPICIYNTVDGVCLFQRISDGVLA